SKSYSKSFGVKRLQFITHSPSAPPETLPAEFLRGRLFMRSQENSAARRIRVFAMAPALLVHRGRADVSCLPQLLPSESVQAMPLSHASRPVVPDVSARRVVRSRMPPRQGF